MNNFSRRDPRAHLWDAVTAADHIQAFVSGRSRGDHRTDVLLRSAVERELDIIGDALGRMATIAPDLAARVPDLGSVVGVRDMLAHRYWGLDDEIVWSVAVDTLPLLRPHLQALLDELNE